MDELYWRIVDSYKQTGSLNKTAEELGTYPAKVRRVLITEGLWHSRTSDQILEMLAQGLHPDQIGEKLNLSEKTVQSYLPCSRGQSSEENRSSEAVPSEEDRERMQKAAENQVTRKEKAEKKQKEMEEEIKGAPLAIQLHLELDMDSVSEGEKEVLKEYGCMTHSISRDFIVPGTMTLHGLHYAIMKAFGWQNSHLHSYVPGKDEFQKMTEGGLTKEWLRQVGMYFRFPDGDYQDLYWDDDYEEGMNIKSWLRSKYCGPYIYYGDGENYLSAQQKAQALARKYPDILSKTTDQREWGFYMEGACEELIERLMIRTVLVPPGKETDWDLWKEKKEEALGEAEKRIKSGLKKRAHLVRKLNRTADCAKEAAKSEERYSREMISCIKEMRDLDTKLWNLYSDHNPQTAPALSSLRYKYDYGDGWEIKITCSNAWYDRCTYVRDENETIRLGKEGYEKEKILYVDAFGREVTGEFLNRLKEIQRKEKPVCIAWDGINLVDDVGGIHGFCSFLQEIHGNDPENKKLNKDWARSLGWTGKMSKPENIL